MDVATVHEKTLRLLESLLSSVNFPPVLKEGRIWVYSSREINYLALTPPLVVVAMKGFW
jgi:hypothetical protein